MIVHGKGEIYKLIDVVDGFHPNQVQCDLLCIHRNIPYLLYYYMVVVGCGEIVR